MKGSSIISRELLEKLKEKEKIEKELSVLNAEVSSLSMQLYNAMDDEGVSKIMTNEGIEFKQTMEISYRLTEQASASSFDDCPEWFQWLKDNHLSGVIKTKESVHHRTREKVLKEYVESNKQLPEFIRETSYNTVKWNKSAIKRIAKDEE